MICHSDPLTYGVVVALCRRDMFIPGCIVHPDPQAVFDILHEGFEVLVAVNLIHFEKALIGQHLSHGHWRGEICT